MPIVHIELLEGRTHKQKSNMVKEVTEAIVRNTGAKPDDVRIVIQDMSPADYAVGGRLKVDISE